MLWSKAFWRGLSERCVKTFAQSFVAAIATLGIVEGSSTIESVPWLTVLSVAGPATLLSVVTSIGNAEFTAGTPKG